MSESIRVECGLEPSCKLGYREQTVDDIERWGGGGGGDCIWRVQIEGELHLFLIILHLQDNSAIGPILRVG